MNDFFIKALEWLKNSPIWTRYVVPFLLAAIVAIYLTSCGSIRSIGVERSTVRDIQDTIKVRITQRVERKSLYLFGAKRLSSRMTPHAANGGNDLGALAPWYLYETRSSVR